MSGIRQPFPWEPQLHSCEDAHAFGVRCPGCGFTARHHVSLPDWAHDGVVRSSGGEHRNARHAVQNIARRHMDDAREQGVTDYTYDTALEVGRQAAYRHDDRN